MRVFFAALLMVSMSLFAVGQQPGAKKNATATKKPAQSTAAPKSQAATSPSSTASAQPASGVTEQVVNEFMRHSFGHDPNLKWRVAEIKPADDPSLTEVTVVVNTPEGQQGLKLMVTPNHKFAAMGDLIPFGADPFAEARNTLQQKMNGPSRGPANAPLTIVEFGDLQCPACKRAQPVVEQLLKEVPNARFVFQQFPLTQIHPWAMTAAKYALCVAKQNNDAHWKFVDSVYQHQDEMQQMTEPQAAARLKQYAGEAGVNADQAEQCTKDPAIAAQIEASSALARELEVTGTPTLFVGGRKIGNVSGIPPATLKAIAEFQAQNK
ncbi:MAG TPA: thioredoxin domain-containing protein [Terriglobales bacterium]|nr:thioredoxin domain-containing protein [Terriglobales bacterium]